MTQIEPTPPIDNSKSTLKVHTPLSRRASNFFRRYVPIVAWISGIALLIPLAQKQSEAIDAIGVVERINATVRPELDGRIVELKVNLFQQVEAGDEIARLDDTEYQAKVNSIHAEIDHIRSELASTSESIQAEYALLADETKQDNFNDMRRFEINEEDAHLDLIDREVTQKADTVALSRLTALVRYQKNMLDQGVGVKRDYEDLSLQKSALEKKIDENEKAIAFAKERLVEAKRRRASQVLRFAPDRPTLGLSLLHSSAKKLEKARMQELEIVGEKLILRAPIAGTISEILVTAGEVVVKGTDIAEINSDHASHVLGYVDESMVANLKEGMAVTLHMRRFPYEAVESTVANIGTKFDRFPLRLRPNPNLPQWGLAIMVDLPEASSDKFYPNEKLDIRFTKPEESKI